VELRSFFDRAVRASFRDLALHDDAAAGYLADLLARFDSSIFGSDKAA